MPRLNRQHDHVAVVVGLTVSGLDDDRGIRGLGGAASAGDGSHDEAGQEVDGGGSDHGQGDPEGHHEKHHDSGRD